MIPKIIHQTWREADVPRPFNHMTLSWRQHHPDWEYRLWTDEDLEELARSHYPHLLDQFRAYRHPVQRADIGRYMILHRHGGVYADIDTTCLASFAPLSGEQRIVFAREPREHENQHALYRGLDWIAFNGTLVSPRGHGFWEEVLAMSTRCRHARDVLESTGPLMLTGCILRHRDQHAFARHSCHIFNPLTSLSGASADSEFGPYADLRLSVHHWAGTWYSVPGPSISRKSKRLVRAARYRMTRGDVLPPDHASAAISTASLLSGLPANATPENQNVAIFVPARDAARDLTRCIELIGRLELPRERVKLAFCEGDSVDDTREAIKSGLAALGQEYRDKQLLHFATGVSVGRDQRHLPRLQRVRRSALARVRNHLVDHGLGDDDDWVLWIDADVCDYPTDIVGTLMAARAKIVVPHCVLKLGGRSYDLNNFLEVNSSRDSTYYKHVIGGLYQPPADTHRRRHLHDLRYLDRVPLTGVGGTMLLVHASVFRAGLRFPEVPYRDLIETEGFGQLACDCGLRPIGLPNAEIVHASA